MMELNRRKGSGNQRFPVAEVLEPRGSRTQAAKRPSSEIPANGSDGKTALRRFFRLERMVEEGQEVFLGSILDSNIVFGIYSSDMLAIKLQRIGKKHKPAYRLVVAERRSKMIAPPVEDLGFYDPFTKAAGLKKERVLHWISVGAQPTITAHNLLVKQGIVLAKAKAVKMKKPAAKTPEAVAA